jgi:hypothetical protein
MDIRTNGDLQRFNDHLRPAAGVEAFNLRHASATPYSAQYPATSCRRSIPGNAPIQTAAMGAPRILLARYISSKSAFWVGLINIRETTHVIFQPYRR